MRKYREGYPMHKALHSSVNHSLEFVNRTSGTYDHPTRGELLRTSVEKI